jgi:RNA polymerase sigma-70 factor (ECF subfamily)
VGADHSRRTLDAYAVSSIKQHALRLIRRAGFTSEDFHDIVQELTIHLWEQLDRFDPSRGKRTTFIDRVVRNKAADILEARRAACRDCRLEMESIHEVVPADDGEDACLEDLAETDAVRSQQGLSHDPFERGVELRVDLLRALARLSPEQLDLCRRLLENPNRSRIAADLGISRDTLYQSIHEIRAIFEQAGLRVHLGEESRHSGGRSRK